MLKKFYSVILTKATQKRANYIVLLLSQLRADKAALDQTVHTWQANQDEALARALLICEPESQNLLRRMNQIP